MSTNILSATANQKTEFDYKNHAWIVGGFYVDCGHDHNKPCPGGNCYGREHNGEKASR